MNLEEAKANIGEEVIFIGERASCHTKLLGNNIVIDSADDHHAIIMSGNGHKSFINLREIKLKEQPMNYKIKVTPETSAEVQELFFELGGKWITFGSNTKHVYGDLKLSKIYFSNGVISGGWCDKNFEKGLEQEITLPQLRDLVVLKRNNVGDSTEMTWEDALRAVADGKEVERLIGDEWFAMGNFSNDKFRLKPQTIHIDGGKYTKEELLKIAGEME